MGGLDSNEWREWDLNPRPRAYESPALPLSYLAVCEAPGILLWDAFFVNFYSLSQIPVVHLFPEFVNTAAKALNAW